MPFQSNDIEDYHLNQCGYLLPLNRWQSEDAVVVVVAVNASSIRDKTVAKSQLWHKNSEQIKPTLSMPQLSDIFKLSIDYLPPK